MRTCVLCLIALAGIVSAQSANLERTVGGQTLHSPSDPAVSITFDPAFHYAGGQVIDILHVAGAEQYFFVDASASDKQIKRFYWIQFEHMYPSTPHTYHYDNLAPLPDKLGGLAFVADTNAFDNYFSMDDRPGSDSEAARKFLTSKGFKLDGAFVRTRMFNLPDASKKKELMIIYGELVPDTKISENMKQQNLKHAEASMKIAPR